MTADQHPEDLAIERLASGSFDDFLGLYRDWQTPVNKALEWVECPPEWRNTFFRTALLHTAELAAAGELPLHAPFGAWLSALAKAHYLGYQIEQGQEVDEESLIEGDLPMPNPEALSLFRRKMYAWRKWHALPEHCRDLLQDESMDWGGEDPCLHSFVRALDRGTHAPDWAKAALGDPTGLSNFMTTQGVERHLKIGDTAAAPTSKATYRWLLVLFGFLLLASYLISRFFINTSAETQFDNNFQPPKSLLGDLRERYGPARGNDSSGARPAACDQLLEQADQAYSNKQYSDAKDALLLITLEGESVCASDAWFYLAVIALEEEDPGTALRCLAKIEDLEYFGEDIYWYQALAFVQLSAQNTVYSERAEGALRRFLDTSRDEVRRAKAQKMLDELRD